MTTAAWHAASVSETLAALDTSASGLTTADAARRLARYGPNELEPPKPASILSILVDQVTSVVVWLLAAAAAIAFLMGDHVEAAAIAGVLVINTAIGFVIDLRARRAMEALLQFQVPHAAVVRDGRLSTIEARELVPGDIIEIFHLGNARSSGPVLSLPAATANPAAIGAVLLSLGLQIAALLIAPLAAVLRLTPLGAEDWAVIVILSAIPAAAGQLLKVWRQ